jgi:GxxExxY protein
MSAPAHRDPQTYAIIGAAMAVHSELGPGFLEAVYQEALAIELNQLGVVHQREIPVAIRYKGRSLRCLYRADFLCFDEVIVELKATATVSPADEAQVIHYLRATSRQRGLLLNFGSPHLFFRRIVLEYHSP